MPRKQFVEDLQKAKDDTLPLGITNLQQGEDDGQFEFEFIGTGLDETFDPVKVTAMVPDVSEYPKTHGYMLFCGDNALPRFGAALQDVHGTNRKTVFELLDIISASLLKLSPDQDGDMEMPDSQSYDEDQADAEDSDEDDVYDSDHEAFDMNPQLLTTAHAQPPSGMKLKPSDRAFRSRIRSDLLGAKSAGFKVGHLGGLLDGYNSYVTVSIRMSKLGISEEAMQAWQVTSKDYLILIIQYPNGYKTNEELQGLDSLRLTPNIGFRVCASTRYKPTLDEAMKAFTVVKKSEHRDSIPTSDIPAPEEEVNENTLRETFISRPLNNLLQERLVAIIRYRSAGMEWRGAEEWYSEVLSNGKGAADSIPDSFFEPEVLRDNLPRIATADHFAAQHVVQHSFPLLAMQFLLRHFVRCTDYCLVCHRQLKTDLEAIKPYVCDQSLCLYQYMTLGFGPSIEHEILAQPYVVDLLISFCYNSAAARKLRDFPDGLSLVVPPVSVSVQVDPQYPSPARRHTVPDKKEMGKKAESNLPVHEVGFDRDRLEILFFDKTVTCPVKRGSWIVVKTTTGTLDLGAELHCRVLETTYFPSIKIDEPVVVRPSLTSQQTAAQSVPQTPQTRAPNTITPATTPKWATATFQVYEQDFEELDSNAKCIAICHLLDTLPTVKHMQEFLTKNRPADLKNWVERISPAALSLLRWIIASNRACIMQVDGDTTGSSKPQERLFGMKGYIQFRFAMGAPDKEQRFINEVRKTAERLQLKFPTIFAFHGSPLHNWHTIIREGLHYNRIDHGRAYGDGVYHAKDAQTSGGYSGMASYGYNGAPVGRSAWSHSVLKISSAMALNELINAPAEFTSNQPYYVVQHLDWIQTRYLFIQCSPDDDNMKDNNSRETKPATAHPQDPSRTPRGISDAVVIPASAISSGRVTKSAGHTLGRILGESPFKRLKGLGGFNNPIDVDGDDDADSVATDPEDLAILCDDDPDPEPIRADSRAEMMKKPSKETGTDFVAGQLDFDKLPLMLQPTYAVSGTSRRLLKDIQSLQKVQDATPLADLGWYIDTEKIENVYQWIVELHSFHMIDKKLPLVADMKRKDIKSVVLEVRFNKDFPYTPPYVRVIRPRFLTFNQGGGGHVVMGGAMCMELLTNTGWSSVSSMESVLMQVRLAIASDPPAKLDMVARGDYGTAEAADGYMRACAAHGWTVPPGFKEMALASGN